MLSTEALCISLSFFFQAEDGIRDIGVTGVQTCALPIYTATTEIYTHSTPPSNPSFLRVLGGTAKHFLFEHACRSVSCGRGGPYDGGSGADHRHRLEDRSEERRVGKEGRFRGWPYQ